MERIHSIQYVNFTRVHDATYRCSRLYSELDERNGTMTKTKWTMVTYTSCTCSVTVRSQTKSGLGSVHERNGPIITLLYTTYCRPIKTKDLYSLLLHNNKFHITIQQIGKEVFTSITCTVLHATFFF